MEMGEGGREGGEERKGKRAGERERREGRDEAVTRCGDRWPFPAKKGGGWRRREGREEKEAAFLELLLLSSWGRGRLVR